MTKFRPELIDELLIEYQNPEDLMGQGEFSKNQPKPVVPQISVG